MTLVGELCLWIALLMAAWSVTVSFAAAATARADLAASGRRAIDVAAVALAFAAAGVTAALVARDFSFAYVARHASLDLPVPYAVSALWSGTAGGLLVFAFSVAALGSVAVRSVRRRERSESAWVAAGIGLELLAATIAACFVRNPFDRLGWLAGDGLGLDPVLRHAELVPARLAVIAGLGVAGVGAAVAAGALAVRGRESALRRIRGWLLPAWTLLSLGLALIAHGGYAYAAAGMPWAWTPLSIVAFVAWGVASAALHRGAPRQWRVGEHLAHVGAAAVLVGVAAGAFSSAQSFAVRTGQDANVAGGLGGHWRFESQGVSRYGAADHDVTAVTLESWRNGAPKGLIVSQRLDYGTDQSDAPPVTVLRPALRSSGLADMRVTVDSTAGDLAYVRVQFVPLAWLLWLGAALLVLGGGAAMLPVAGGGAGGNA